MATVTTVELPKSSSGARYSAIAEWWGDRSHFAVVRFLVGGIEKFSLRLDLDKRVFLDHAPDAETDQAIQARVQTIWSDVVRAKRSTLSA